MKKGVKSKQKISTLDIELAVVKYLNPRQNLIVPNISWGLDIHECDLLSLSQSGYATEIEIKISRQDLINDIKKTHNHVSPKIKYLYFATPEHLLTDAVAHVPKAAGIIVVRDSASYPGQFTCVIMRKPQSNCRYKLSDAERYQVARLGTMRIWNLKGKLNKKEQKNENN